MKIWNLQKHVFIKTKYLVVMNVKIKKIYCRSMTKYEYQYRNKDFTAKNRFFRNILKNFPIKRRSAYIQVNQGHHNK